MVNVALPRQPLGPHPVDRPAVCFAGAILAVMLTGDAQ
jgi:hypothetical protein